VVGLLAQPVRSVSINAIAVNAESFILSPCGARRRLQGQAGLEHIAITVA
jgi:hypothetical protein